MYKDNKEMVVGNDIALAEDIEHRDSEPSQEPNEEDTQIQR